MGLASIAVFAACSVQAANLPGVGPATAVDVGVSSVSWNPNGTALYYTRAGETQVEVGLFAAGQPHGNVVLKLGLEDRYEVQWFESTNTAIFIVYRTTNQSGSPKSEATVFLADAVSGTAQVAYWVSFPSKDGVDLDVDPSPRYRHAIFRVKNGQNRFHMVLPTTGNRLVACPDLDSAVRSGASGPTWSIDGTAVYGDGQGVYSQELILGGTKEVIRTSKVVDLASSILFRFKLPAPPTGSSVFELMPTNAVLRQVRFKGEWLAPSPNLRQLATVTRPVNVQWDSFISTANSLWLIDEQLKQPGVLVSPNAHRSWLAPMNAGIAYTTDNALFVREFQSKLP